MATANFSRSKNAVETSTQKRDSIDVASARRCGAALGHPDASNSHAQIPAVSLMRLRWVGLAVIGIVLYAQIPPPNPNTTYHASSPSICWDGKQWINGPCPGPQGPQGLPGAVGPIGPVGPMGPQGIVASSTIVTGLGLAGDGTPAHPVSIDPNAVQAALSGVATLNFPAIVQSGCNEQTIAVPGALQGDIVTIGASPIIDPGFVWVGYVGPADTVIVRLCRVGIGTVAPRAVNWRATVTRSF